MNDLFLGAVKEKIQHFNETRGRRKELTLDIVDDIPLPNRRFGRIVSWGDSPMPDIEHRLIPQMAEITVRTLLQLKPRPHKIALAMFERKQKGKYLFRFKLPKKNRTAEVRELELI